MLEGYEMFPGFFFISYITTYLIYKRCVKSFIGSFLGFVFGFIIILFIVEYFDAYIREIWEIPLVYGIPFLITITVLSLVITKIIINIKVPEMNHFFPKKRYKNNRIVNKNCELKTGLKIIFCYYGLWITGLLLLVYEKENELLRFHAKQSIVTSFILFGLITIFIPFNWLNQIILLLGGLLFWFYLPFRSIELNKKLKLPIIGDFVEHHLDYEKFILGLNPLFWPIINILITFIIIFLIPFIPLMNSQLIFIFTNLVIAIFVFPLVALIVNFVYYPVNEKNLGRIVLLFISLLLLFTNIHFDLLLFSNSIPYDGIHPLWQDLAPPKGRTIILENALEAYIDCFHYSIVTMTTLGFGDMHPTTWYSKLITDFQVLIGLGVTVISFGRYFSRK